MRHILISSGDFKIKLILQLNSNCIRVIYSIYVILLKYNHTRTLCLPIQALERNAYVSEIYIDYMRRSDNYSCELSREIILRLIN